MQTDKQSKRKVLRKIPPSVLANAKGLAIFTSMRSGIAPLGGAGGAGVVVARLPDGSWSGPASISPQNLSTGVRLHLIFSLSSCSRNYQTHHHAPDCCSHPVPHRHRRVRLRPRHPHAEGARVLLPPQSHHWHRDRRRRRPVRRGRSDGGGKRSRACVLLC